MDRTRLNTLERKYGLYASWALWSPQTSAVKSGVGDLSIFVGDFTSRVNTEFVLVGLNISRGAVTRTWGNFHDDRSEATDYKIRHAIEGTPLWGCYMTDVIKDFDENNSIKVLRYIRNNRDFVAQQISSFQDELKDLTDTPPTLFAFGGAVYEILQKHFGNSHRIVKIPHYAAYMSKEAYRENVHQQIRSLAC